MHDHERAYVKGGCLCYMSQQKCELAWHDHKQKEHMHESMSLWACTYAYLTSVNQVTGIAYM